MDNFAKIVSGIYGYVRYTDDFYAISDNREKLLALMEGLRAIAKDLGIIINERKTRIVKLSSFYRHFNMSKLYIELFRRNPKWKKGHSKIQWLMEHKN